MIAPAALAVAVALSFGQAGTQYAFTVPPAPGDSYVYDGANILSQEEEAALAQRLVALKASTPDKLQLAVGIFPSLNGEILEETTHRIAEGWGIGQKGQDNGVLLAFFMAERKMRIEVGYGLEDRLTDAMSKRIISEQITPHFKRAEYETGIVKGAEAIALVASGKPLPTPVGGAGRTTTRTPTQGIPIGSLLCMGIFLLMFLRGLFGARRPRNFGPGYRRRGRHGYAGAGIPWWAWFLLGSMGNSNRHSNWGGGGGFGGGSGGGGFGGGGFGGGSFGGGGASGDW